MLHSSQPASDEINYSSAILVIVISMAGANITVCAVVMAPC